MSNKLYVGNLSYSMTEELLADEFASYGTVNSVKIIKDRDTNRSKGFGFVEMSSSSEAQSAIDALHGKVLAERTLTVNEAKPVANRDDGRKSFSRNRDGGSNGGGNRFNRW